MTKTRLVPIQFNFLLVTVKTFFAVNPLSHAHFFTRTSPPLHSNRTFHFLENTTFKRHIYYPKLTFHPILLQIKISQLFIPLSTKMDRKIDPILVPLLLTCIAILLQRIPVCVGQNASQYETCRQPFQCGNIRGMGYPFWGGDRLPACGYPGFDLDCRGDVPLLNMPPLSYRVLDFDNSTRTLRVAREDLWNTTCPRFLFNTTINSALFEYSATANDQNVTLFYGCGLIQPPITTPTILNQFNCDVNGSNTWSFYLTSEASGLGNGAGCSSNIHVPVNRSAVVTSRDLLQGSLAGGFSIQWSAENDNCDVCGRSGGVCGYGQDTASFACYCADGTHEFSCNDIRPGGNGTYVLIHSSSSSPFLHFHAVNSSFAPALVLPCPNAFPAWRLVNRLNLTIYLPFSMC